MADSRGSLWLTIEAVYGSSLSVPPLKGVVILDRLKCNTLNVAIVIYTT